MGVFLAIALLAIVALLFALKSSDRAEQKLEVENDVLRSRNRILRHANAKLHKNLKGKREDNE